MFVNLTMYIDIIRLAILYWLSNKNNEIEYKKNKENSIPKVIHFVWFGNNPYPTKIEECMKSWEKLEGYTIKKWDESNFPFEKYPFAKKAYENKKWAFVSDVARLHAVYTEGGIYLDSDIEVLKNFDDLLKYDGFLGIEDSRMISNAIMGSKKGNPLIGLLLKWYDVISYKTAYIRMTNTRIVTKIIRIIYGIKVDKQGFMLPFNTKVLKDVGLVCTPNITDTFYPTEETYAIHHITGSWGDTYVPKFEK